MPAFALGQGVRASSLTTGVEAQASYVVDSRSGGRSDPDLVTELRPGLRWEGRSGRVVGSLAYSLGLSHHTKEFTGERVQNQLNAALSAEVVDRWMYVDGSATISQQAASAFGTQTAPGSALDNRNKVEVGTATLSPAVRGVLGTAVNYEARLTASATNARRSIVADFTTVGATLSLSSAFAGTALGWGLVANSQETEYRVGGKSKFERASASLTYAIDADLNLVLRGGQESTNAVDVASRTYTNWGAGATWRPGPRTRLQTEFDERYFGRSYRALLDHRMASSAIQISSSRDASNGSDPNGTTVRLSLYDVLFAQSASVEPDPTLRDALVRNFLLAQGRDPDEPVLFNVINTAVTVQDRHQVILTYAGRRLSGSMQAFMNKNEVVSASFGTTADQNYRQWGYVTTASYRLTPTANVGISGSRLLTQSSATRAGTELKSLSMSISDQIARRTSVSFSARYSVFNSTTDPYREASVSASLSQRF